MGIDTDVDVTRAVTDRHIAAFLGRDIDAFMADYADDAWTMFRGVTFRGAGQLRAAVLEMFEEWAKPTSRGVVDYLHCTENVGFFIWHGETAVTIIHSATDTLILRDGKIAQQTGAGLTTSKVA